MTKAETAIATKTEAHQIGRADGKQSVRAKPVKRAKPPAKKTKAPAA
jgi:hypothetical protein